MAGEDRVLIIGGGPAGLLAAQALQKQGLKCTVFEQDKALDARPRDWNFGIYWAQSPLADCLPDELSNLVEGTQVDSRAPSESDVLPIYNGKTGELIKAIPAPFNIRLQRRKFLRLISRGIDIRYDKRLVNLESNGTVAKAHFEDGTVEAGQLLIGAEGAHSKVREYLLGKEKADLEMSPLVASVTMAKLPAGAASEFQKLQQRSTVSFHPNGIFTWLGDPGTLPGQWTFMVIHSWIPEPSYDPASLQGSDILKDMKERADLYAEPFKSIFQSIPDGTHCWHNRLSYWIPEPWDNRNGTVTLIGDAAHPMTFHRGQGLNNAIHDVADLARHIKENGKIIDQSTIAAYEQEMRQRGKEAVIGSNENSVATHNWEKLLQSPLFTSGLKQKLEADKGGEPAKD